MPSISHSPYTPEQISKWLQEADKERCTCPCHKNSDMKHIMPCCQGGFKRALHEKR